jgi:hypothetical protein
MRSAMVLIVVGGLILIVYFLSEAHRRGIVQKHSYDALITVAWASLDYMRERGDVPQNLDSLVQAGILRRDQPSGKLISNRPERYYSVIEEYARRVHVSIPRTTEGYVVRNGAVVRCDNGEPLAIAHCPGIDAGMVARANEELAREWYNIVARTEEFDRALTTRP